MGIINLYFIIYLEKDDKLFECSVFYSDEELTEDKKVDAINRWTISFNDREKIIADKKKKGLDFIDTYKILKTSLGPQLVCQSVTFIFPLNFLLIINHIIKQHFYDYRVIFS